LYSEKKKVKISCCSKVEKSYLRATPNFARNILRQHRSDDKTNDHSVQKDAAIFPAVVAQPAVLTVRTDPPCCCTAFTPALEKGFPLPPQHDILHTTEVTARLPGGAGVFLEPDPAPAETNSVPGFGQSSGEEERRGKELVTSSVPHHRWVDVSQSTAILLSLKLTDPGDCVQGGFGWQSRKRG